MALSFVDYVGNGAATVYTFTPKYIATPNVLVTVDGVVQVDGVDYSWISSTAIQFAVAPAGATAIRLARFTERNARLVDYQDAGNLTELQLDTDSRQSFFLAQESFDNYEENGMKLDIADFKWEAQNKVIKNVADPVVDADAASKGWVNTSAASAVAAAAGSAAAASASASSAATSETNAATSKTNAAASEFNAQTSANNAVSSQLAAGNSETAAALSETNAGTSETNAGTSETNAGTSETNAAASETNAGTSETNAAVSETNAAASAFDAAASAAASAKPNVFNMVINGGFHIHQRGTTTATPAVSEQFVFDRWRNKKSGSATGSVNVALSTIEDIPTNSNALEVTVAIADVPGAAVHYGVTQAVSGLNSVSMNNRDFTYNKGPVTDTTLSFSSAHSVAGTYTVAAQNGDRSYSRVITYTQTTANVWEKQSITFKGAPNVGQSWWDDRSNVGLNLTWMFGSGSNYTAVGDTWLNGDKRNVSGSVNLMATVGNKFRIAEVQMEDGATATQFSYAGAEAERDRCLPYYEKSYDASVTPGTINAGGASVLKVGGLPASTRFVGITQAFSVSKVTAPTMTGYSIDTGAAGQLHDLTAAADVAVSMSFIGENGFRWGTAAALASTVDLNIALQWVADSEI